ncbi:hypothetical protein SPBR_05565 [Sporothrix brasiliensis 5110]|uniref:Pentatricopeptide repeat protein n=1 Tax=Sporothrix brasiliensis 5110 TaxID=1398154 RepID=A0A0C2FT70_9PEZI|nr:uncharacterized protein SPBR_05565 [Sporothrix brasiliensis 5110]KIH94208.1 hypothetical protein SPBR_05565 [Sporothrix brasiliensis 5110]
MQRLRPLLSGGRPVPPRSAAGRCGDGLGPASIGPETTHSRRFSTSRGVFAGAAEQTKADIVSWVELAKEREERKQREIEEQRRRENGEVLESTNTDGVPQPTPSPGATLLNSLAGEPIVPRPANLSVLVEPAMDYEHRSETFHSRMRHGKSVFRQERLEVIRQAQLRPLPDWRVILQRLAAATPGKDELLVPGVGGTLVAPRLASGLTPSQFVQLYSMSRTASPLAPLLQQHLPHQSGAPGFKSQAGQYRRNAVSLAFPGDSPSIQELLHGVDGTLWKISGRSGCILRLYRRNAGTLGQTQSADDVTDTNAQRQDADHSWLLTLSGTMPSIYRAASEVTFFAKDAVPVAVSPNVRLDDRRAEQPPPSSISPTQLRQPVSSQAEDQSSETAPDPTATQTWSLVSSSYYLDDSKQLADYVLSPHVTDIGAHEIPRPEVWTRESFVRYVAALVNGRPPAHLAPQLYPQSSSWSRRQSTENDDERGNHADGQAQGQDTFATADSNPVLNSHDRTVADLLHSLFDDDAVRDVLSLSAFKLALAFLSKHGETYRPEARALFVRAERLRLRMDTDTFNILLASVVKTQDLRNFSSTLALMENRGHMPNLTTWVLFLQLFESEEVKRHILHAMQARGGLLDSPEARQCIAQEMAEYDVLRAIAEHRQEQREKREQNQIYNDDYNPAAFFDGFMASQAERYGSDWLTRPAANRILEVFASHSRFAECQEMLGILTRKQDWRHRVEQAKVQKKQQQQHLLQEQQHQQSLSPQNEPSNLVSAQALNTTSFNIVLTHAKRQFKLRHALAIVRQMDAVSDGVVGTRVDNEADQDQAQVPVETTTPATVAITRSPPSTRAVPADGVTYHLLHEMAYHRRMSYAMGAVWVYASILRRTNHWMNKKAGRVLAGDTGPQTAHLVKVLRGEFGGQDGHHPGRDRASFASIGAAASARWASYYDGWEPALPLSQVLEEALDRDNALLKDRFDQGVLGSEERHGRDGRPPPPPLRIPLRRKLVTRGKSRGTNRSRGPEYSPQGGPAYVEIQPDWLPPKKETKTTKQPRTTSRW